MVRFAYVAGVLMFVASPAAAQTAPASAPQARDIPSSDASDVNRIVCKKTEQIGSRLGAKKLCLTIKEWAERASEDRNETGRVQQGTQLGLPEN